MEFEPLSKPLARVALGLPAQERVILQLGRMVPRKGVDTVIRSLAYLIQEHQTPAKLIVVGVIPMILIRALRQKWRDCKRSPLKREF